MLHYKVYFFLKCVQRSLQYYFRLQDIFIMHKFSFSAILKGGKKQYKNFPGNQYDFVTCNTVPESVLCVGVSPYTYFSLCMCIDAAFRGSIPCGDQMVNTHNSARQE